MTAHQLAMILIAGPDLMVTQDGYEGGVTEITKVDVPTPLHLNAHDKWYYGAHEYHREAFCPVCEETPLPSTPSAIHLS